MIGSSSQDIRLRDTISFPTTEILVPRQQKEELSSQAAAPGARGITMQRIFVDSRTIHFTGIAGARYDIYTCNGKKIVQRKGSEINGYLSHAPHGVYMIVSTKQ
jgi:hypothetical protein